jgi:hypothetical protein
VQYKTYPFAGGDRFFGYRYPLEGLMALVPLLFLSYQTWEQRNRLAKWISWAGVAVALGLQAWAVFHPNQL